MIQQQIKNEKYTIWGRERDGGGGAWEEDDSKIKKYLRY